MMLDKSMCHTSLPPGVVDLWLITDRVWSCRVLQLCRLTKVRHIWIQSSPQQPFAFLYAYHYTFHSCFWLKYMYVMIVIQQWGSTSGTGRPGVRSTSRVNGLCWVSSVAAIHLTLTLLLLVFWLWLLWVHSLPLKQHVDWKFLHTYHSICQSVSWFGVYWVAPPKLSNKK